MTRIDEFSNITAMVEGQVYGARGEWEKHETGDGHTVYVKPIHTRDVEVKARIASRFDELGFIPKFFRESGREFVALEGIKRSRYKTVEEAFVQQIAPKL